MIRVLFLSFLLVLLFAPASGFFPETEDIESKIHDNLGRVSSLQAEFLFANDGELVWRVWQKGRQWRSEWVDKEKNRVLCASVGRGSEVLGAFPAGTETGPPPSWVLLQGVSRLKGRGLDPEKKEYAFLGDRPCIVLGGYDSGDKGLRLWVDNEEMLPLRVDFGPDMHLQWRDFSRTGNFPLPRTMSVQADDGSSLDIEINWTGVNVSLPQELFSVPEFKDKFRDRRKRRLPDTVRFCNRFFSGFLGP
ncbi:MAG: hypothetical protein ACLFSY_11080 [Desulfonatronovibrionaceae bacterium]